METTAVIAEIEGENSPLPEIQPKTHFTGKVIKTSIAGAIIDIGLDKPGVVHISQLTKDPVNKVEDVVQIGDEVDVWIRRVFPKKGRIELTMVRPLELEWKEIEPEMVVKGKVTRLEKFGAFVDIGAERPGLVHISELAHGYVKDPSDVVHEGDEVEVKVLKVSRRKRQIKLSMKALMDAPAPVEKPERERARPKTRRQESAPMEEVVDEGPPVPTAMEAALREAMEKSQRRVDIEAAKTRKKLAATNPELEDILTRTLENKVRSK